jgi:hypothetical protein
MRYTGEWKTAFRMWPVNPQVEREPVVAQWAINPHVYDGYYRPTGWRTYVVLPREE